MTSDNSRYKPAASSWSLAIVGTALLASVGCHPPEASEEKEIPAETADIQVPADFLFPTSFELAIEVDVSDRIPGRSYFQICSSYAEMGDGYKIDYGSCLLRGPLIDGRLSQKVQFANHLESLIVELVQFDETALPEHQIFDTAELRSLEVLSIQ